MAGLRAAAQARFLARRKGIDGDHLEGISVESVRVINELRDLVGLSPADSQLMTAFVDFASPHVVELHTHVPCGWKDIIDGELFADSPHRAIAAAYARRADGVVLTTNAWHIIECKPVANHTALGQCMFYGLHLGKADPELAAAQLHVVTFDADRDFREVYDAHKVNIVLVDSAGGVPRVIDSGRLEL